MKTGQNVCLDENSDNVENGSKTRSRTRSVGQILEKHCIRFIGHIFSPIIIKLDQHVCLNENGSCLVKN